MNYRAWRLDRTGTPPEADTYDQRASGFGGTVRNTGSATLLVTKSEEGKIERFVLAPDNNKNPERVASNAASALGAKYIPCDGESNTLPKLEAPYVARLVARPMDNGARETQSGASPDQVALMLSQSMESGDWVAIGLRQARKREIGWSRTWYEHRLGNSNTHHSRSNSAVVASIWAGSSSRQQTDSLLNQIASLLPGFDIETKVRRPMGWQPFAAVANALAVLSWFVPGLVIPVVSQLDHTKKIAVPEHSSYMPFVLVVCVAIIALGFFASPRRRALRHIAKTSSVPVPQYRMSAPKKPRKESTKTNQDGSSKTIHEFSGDYPLHDTAFLVGPSVVLGVANPHAGDADEAAGTRARIVPTKLLRNIGPMLGTGGLADEAVHISQADRFGGFGCFGKPNSGKSVVVTNIYAYDVALRVRARKMEESGIGWTPAVDGDTGMKSTLIAFENKGADGVPVYERWCKNLGDDLNLVEVADGNTPAIDMFGPSNMPPRDRAIFFVDSMRYAMGSDAVGHRSTGTLVSVFYAALMMLPSDIKRANQSSSMIAPIDETNTSVVELASVLLGNKGDEAGVALAAGFFARAMKATGNQSKDLKEAASELMTLYGDKVTASARRSLLEAPKTKVAELVKAGTWFHFSRPKLRWEDILNSHLNVVINAGPSTSGAHISSTTTKYLLSMLTYGLKNAIEMNCAGWKDEGRSVTIFSDELSLLVHEDYEIFAWMRNAGRSYGIRLVFATQLPEQLEDTLLTTVMGFSLFLWLGQNDTGVAEQAVKDLTGDGSTWAPEEIITMTPHHGALRCDVNELRQPSVPVHIAYYDKGRDYERFLEEQGLAE